MLRTHPSARAELRGAADEFAKARTGYGLLFTAAVKAAYERLERMPRMYAIAEDAPEDVEVREVFLARFKYRVLYLVRPDELLIVAVAYAGRRPGYWHDRLSTPGDYP